MEDALHKITLRQLQIFLVAAENLSFIQTAKILELTPPAVSMQMARLGKGLGAPLFERQGRQVILTLSGEKLISYAEKVTQTIRDASEEIERVQGKQRQSIRVAMVTTSRNFGPHLAARFKICHPELNLDIEIANRQSVVEMLDKGEVDVALMGRTPKRIEVEATPFAKHPYVIIASPNHPLAQHTQVDLPTLVDETFLGREVGSGTRMILEYFFQKNKLELPEINEMDSNENIKQAVMANMGLAFISKHTIHLELLTQRIVELKVEGTPMNREWYVIHSKRKALSHAAETFENFVQTQGPQFMADFFAESLG